MTDTAGYKLLEERWNVCKIQEDQKASLIADLFNHISFLSGELSDANQRLEEKSAFIQSMKQKTHDYKEQVDALQTEKEQAKHSFALVVVDGDSMPFLDELVKDGFAGGKKTAGLLRKQVSKELTASGFDLPPHSHIVIRVYANLKGLGKTYQDIGILENCGVLEEFVRGFNMGAPLCDYIDAGNGKECADEKVKENFQLGLNDIHCHRIMFCGSADNGYTRLLDKYVIEDVKREKVVLVEGPPFAYELAKIKEEFRVVELNDVFRTQNLPQINRRVSAPTTPPSTPSGGYAAAAARASFTTTASSSLNQQTSMAMARPNLAGVFRNEAGDRIDSPLNCTPHEVTFMKNRKMCNSFHLLGHCSYLQYNGRCLYEHGNRLVGRDLQALRAVARYTLCQAGLSCNDPDCMYGHR
ncbi:CCCH zinc finger DNA binding protein [Colletotrichum truncatum]|uniref:CCCH zinc finger DNA binding protein n=1 Tax=Colletotrichum truncatum TaxID=5467 RepID=A0ACC3ZL19_COLTU|nr:CCCH zinc finger DNA binding protein [Colletotrichum truncatum]KAF6786936.1 CCCH zinc finger DNA binding protein [Colletotrichum truncatum]